MKEILKKIGLTVTAFAILSFTVISMAGTTVSAAPANPYNAVCAGAMNAVTGACEGGDINSVWDWVGTVTTWLLTAVGAVCVIFIILGGIKYATSGGDSDKVKSAKNTLLYALIGLAISLLAGVIVSLVTTNVPGLFS
jgi:hypothetical protein